jgi:hypothetical protein
MTIVILKWNIYGLGLYLLPNPIFENLYKSAHSSRRSVYTFISIVTPSDVKQQSLTMTLTLKLLSFVYYTSRDRSFNC